MRFFSEEWHRGDLPAAIAEHVPTAYLAHLRSLSPPAPSAAIRLAEEIRLHDGLIREFTRHTTDVNLLIRAGDQQVGYYDALLRYEKARLSPEDEQWLQGSAGRRDIEVLYDEFDSTDDGVWVHRFLFWPYHEIAVRFHAIELLVSKVGGRFEGAA